MRDWSRMAIFWIVTVFLLLVPGLFAQDCQVVFVVNPPLSNLTVGGAVTKPLTAPLTSVNPEILSGLQGEFVASLPGPCPTDAAGLETALASALLSTTPATGLLELYPSQISLKAGDLATLVLTDVGFNSILQLAVASNQATLNMTIAQGFTNSTSIVTPDGDIIDLVGTTASNTTQASITTEGSKVSITLTNVVITLASEYVSFFAGQPLEGGAEYVLTGSIVMQTVVGCPESCGVNGKCAAAEDGTVGCQCECGWSGAGCTVPSGFCPRYTDDGSAAAICPVNPAPTPVPEPSGGGDGQITACGAAQCSTWQLWDATTGSCQCKEGFEGPGCDACKDDAACSAYFSTAVGQDVSATCSTSRLYSSQTVYKAYKCEVDASTGLAGVEPGTFTVGCNTTTGTWSGGGATVSTPSVAEGSFCEVQLALEGRNNNPITCKASLCAFQSNSSRVYCQSTTCSCRTACPDLDGVFSKIKNQPAVIDCDEAGICSFDIKDFFVTLKAPCTNHECLVEGYVMQEGAYTDDPSDNNWTPLIAAIPLIALVAAACVFSFYLLANRAFFKGAQKSNGTAVGGDVAAAAVGKVGAAAASSSQIVDHVREIAFFDINKIVPMRGGEPRAILSHVTGVARMGELVGVLGPSGGGKTSLLSVLAGSAEDSGSNAIITGSVTLDGRPLDTSLARRVAYCAQDCTLLSTLTVEECVRYSALLRLPGGTSSSEVATVVTNVIDELGLSKVAGALVGGGSGIRGVSGGERRRITIGMELVTNPAILILDEPTSGLDSFTAYQMMSTLKSVANSGRIVMLSFHQPSPAMFNLLDRCFLMAQGRCVFTGSPKGVEAHFAGIGLPVPAGVGGAEHMLHCACDPALLPTLLSSVEGINPDDNVKSLKTTVEALNTVSEDAEAGVVINAASPATTVTASASSSLSSAAHPAGAGLSRQLAVLFWRALMDIIRNPTLLLLHWVMGLLMGLFGGCIFFGVGLDISGAQDRLGAIFFSLAFFAFTSLTTVDLIMNERRIVSREVRGGYYSPATYYVTKAVLDALLLRAIPVLLYSAPFYPMMGFIGGSNHIGLFLMVLATFAVAIGALSLAVAVGSSTPGQASLGMNIILLISLLVGGFFVNAASMPVWISWLRFVSPFFYAYAALTINEFSSLLLNFEVEGYTAVQNVRGTTFLDIVGINYNRLTDYVIVLDCMYVIFLLLGFALLYWRMPRARTLKNKKVGAAAVKN